MQGKQVIKSGQASHDAAT